MSPQRIGITISSVSFFASGSSNRMRSVRLRFGMSSSAQSAVDQRAQRGELGRRRACSAFSAASSLTAHEVLVVGAAGSADSHRPAPLSSCAQRASRAPGARGSLTTSGAALLVGRVASSSRKASTDETSAKRCSRSLLARSSATVCGPRSISVASSATDCDGSAERAARLCS